MMPSIEALEDWKAQSVQFGNHLKSLKENNLRSQRTNTYKDETSPGFKSNAEYSTALNTER